MKAHKEIVNCIDGVGGLGIGDGAPEIVTGSRDGEYNGFDMQSFTSVSLRCPNKIHSSVSAFFAPHFVLFRDSQGLGPQAKGFACC